MDFISGDFKLKENDTIVTNGDITEHLEPKSNQTEKVLSPEELKEKGNVLFKQKEYGKALDFYNQAILLDTNNHFFYLNRCACLMMLNKYSQALEDVQKALKVGRPSLKCYLRETKCHIALGDPTAAKTSIQKGLEFDSNNQSLLNELKNAEVLQFFIDEGDKSYRSKDYRRVVFCMDRALQLGVDSIPFKLLRAESLVFLNRQSEAQCVVTDILRFDPTNTEAIYIRGASLYYEDNIEKAINHFQQVLRLDPDHNKAREFYRKVKLLKSKKEEGNNSFKNGSYEEAYSLYTAALDIDSNNVFTNAKLYLNRAIVCSKLNKLEDAVKDCDSAIKLDEAYLKAYLRRAKCLMDLEKYEEAITDYEAVFRKEKSRENRQLLEQAKRELRRSKQKDYYKILGVPRNASLDTIKKAYKKQALLHHPDRHCDASEEKKQGHEKKFKELGEAYSVLTDPRKKSRYMNEMSNDLNADFDPHELFKAFFTNSPGQGPSQFPFGY